MALLSETAGRYVVPRHQGELMRLNPNDRILDSHETQFARMRAEKQCWTRNQCLKKLSASEARESIISKT